MSEQSMETPKPPATPEFGAVVQGGPAHVYPETGGARIKKITVGDFDNNVYIVECLATGAGVVVDGAAEPDRIIAEAAGIEIVAIVQTHGHHDHVRALERLVEEWNVPVYAGAGDAAMHPVPTTPVGDRDVIAAGDVALTAIFTPGHTPGSTSYLVGDHLFSGDTLFPAGPGNTFGSDEAFAQIMTSLDEKIFALPDHTRVSPGHGLDTTIGRERPYVETWRARGW